MQGEYFTSFKFCLLLCIRGSNASVNHNKHIRRITIINKVLFETSGLSCTSSHAYAKMIINVFLIFNYWIKAFILSFYTFQYLICFKLLECQRLYFYRTYSLHSPWNMTFSSGKCNTDHKGEKRKQDWTWYTSEKVMKEKSEESEKVFFSDLGFITGQNARMFPISSPALASVCTGFHMAAHKNIITILHPFLTSWGERSGSVLCGVVGLFFLLPGTLPTSTVPFFKNP